MAPSIAFVTFGMFIIDEIQYTNDKTSQQNLIGGAGTYAVLGARLVAGVEHASKVSWIVDVGSDFPASFMTLIDSWKTACRYRTDQTRLTTRAWNGYGPNESRSFKYLTPKIRLEVASLTNDQILAESFHMVCSPSRCRDLTTKLLARRQELASASFPYPVIIWEPIPDLCTPSELHNLQKAASAVSIVSPNADELAQFFDGESGLNQDEMVQTLMGWNTGSSTDSTHVVVREGADGSSIYFAPCGRTTKSIHRLHLSAFHHSGLSTRVVDPTGGGNAYLGALAIGMSQVVALDSPIGRLLNKSLFSQLVALYPAYGTDKISQEFTKIVAAAIYAVIAASFAIEQSGVPVLQQSHETEQHPQGETWNNNTFLGRLETYLDGEIDGIRKQIIEILGRFENNL